MLNGLHVRRSLALPRARRFLSLLQQTSHFHLFPRHLVFASPSSSSFPSSQSSLNRPGTGSVARSPGESALIRFYHSHHRRLRPQTSHFIRLSGASGTVKHLQPSLIMDLNGEHCGKRKQPPVPALERPTKQLKPQGPEVLQKESLQGNGNLYPAQSDLDDTRLLPLASGAADTAEWQATIETVVRNVVSIRFCQTCSFDTDPAISSEATGFVVDAERGYILTNRHVVCSGPFWGYCIFDNHEEVQLLALELHRFS